MSKINHLKKFVLSLLTENVEKDKLLTKLQKRIKVLETEKNALIY
jgi:hypothetical protein